MASDIPAATGEAEDWEGQVEEAFLDCMDFFNDVGLAEGDLELEECFEEHEEAAANTALDGRLHASAPATPQQHISGNATPATDVKMADLSPDGIQLDGIKTKPPPTPVAEDGKPLAVPSVAVKPKHVKLGDQISFMTGCTGLWVCSFWLGRSPETFYKLYTTLGLVLFTWRYFSYRARKWHYFLLDLCYACNALLLFHLWFAPRNRLLAVTTFSFNTGPLTASILAFRNSFVMHDMERVTSLFLHLMPACVSWAQKWEADKRKFGEVYSGPVGLKEMVATPLIFYTVWAVLYMWVIFVIAADRIKRRNYSTLFKYVTTRKQGAFAAIARRVPRRIQPGVYLFLHLCFCATAMLFAYAAWHSFWVHTAILVGAGEFSIFHGAIHYFLPRHHSSTSAQQQQQQAVQEPPSARAVAMNGQTKKEL